MGIHCETIRIAQAVGKDLLANQVCRRRPRRVAACRSSTSERIVVGDATRVGNANDAAVQIVELLGPLRSELSRIAGSYIQHPVDTKCHTERARARDGKSEVVRSTIANHNTLVPLLVLQTCATQYLLAAIVNLIRKRSALKQDQFGRPIERPIVLHHEARASVARPIG